MRIDDVVIFLNKTKKNMQDEIEMLESHREPEIAEEVRADLKLVEAMLKIEQKYGV